jgi:putative ABC transport system substrate-binding protein
LDVDFHVFRARNDQDIDAAFSELEALHIAGLVIAPDPYFLVKATRLAELAFIHRIPAIYQYRQFAEAGGLISYSGSPTEGYRLISLYIAGILKGEKAADLPVQQYSKLEMIINLRTARAFGINVPISVLVRADEIIE